MSTFTVGQLEQDALFLAWVLARLENVHGEKPSRDYMIRLGEIAERLYGRPITLQDRILYHDYLSTEGKVAA